MTFQTQIIVAVKIFTVLSVADIWICRVYQRAAVAAAANIFLRAGVAVSASQIGVTAGGAHIFLTFAEFGAAFAAAAFVMFGASIPRLAG